MTTEERPASREEAVKRVMKIVREASHAERLPVSANAKVRLWNAIESRLLPELIAVYEDGKRDERRESMAVDERDGGYETWPVRGHVQKADGSVFTYEEADALIDDFLEFWESKGMGFGGGLGVPTRAGEQR